MFSIGSISGKYEYGTGYKSLADAKLAAKNMARHMANAIAVYDMNFKCVEIVYGN